VLDITDSVRYSIRNMNKDKRVEFRLEEEVKTDYIEHAENRMKMAFSQWIRQALAKIFKEENGNI